MRRATRRSARGQALIEFLIILPILLMLVIVALQTFTVQDKQQRAESAVWYVLRGGSFDFVHNHVKKSDILENVQGMFDDDDVVNVRLDEVIQGKGTPNPAWATASAVFLAPFSHLSFWIDVSLVRQAVIQVDVDNPFAGLGIPGTENFGWIDERERIPLRAQGMLWTSWTSMAKQPNFDQKAADARLDRYDSEISGRRRSQSSPFDASGAVQAGRNQAGKCDGFARELRSLEHTKLPKACTAGTIEQQALRADSLARQWDAYSTAVEGMLQGVFSDTTSTGDGGAGTPAPRKPGGTCGWTFKCGDGQLG